jgi:hypothetical protein
MKSVTPSFPPRLGLPHRSRSGAFRTRKTEFGPSNRRLSHYPNRCVANSTSLSDRRHLRRRHIGNPRTNDAYFVRDGIERCGHWHASSSTLANDAADDLGQLYFGGVVKLRPFIKIVSKLRPQDKAATLGCMMPAWFDRRAVGIRK